MAGLTVKFRLHGKAEHIVITGHNGTDVVDRPSTPWDRQRWPQEYAGWLVELEARATQPQVKPVAPPPPSKRRR